MGIEHENFFFKAKKNMYFGKLFRYRTVSKNTPLKHVFFKTT